ncbi:MAG: hypothetical protein ACI8ZN_002474 [Bacteroidia bacterium]|jgi:hypothetical protein
MNDILPIINFEANVIDIKKKESKKMEEIGIGTRIKHSTYGHGIICRIGLEYLSVSFFEGGLREIERGGGDIEVVEVMEKASNLLSFDEVEDMLHRMISPLTSATEHVDLGEKWKGGTLILEPQDTSLSGKEMPIETFFHKIVMARDRLRVLEQNINSHKVLTDEEKINLQQYISRIYGSLTSFNVLFKNKENHFVGESKKA